MTLASLAALLIPAFVLADLIFTNHTLSLVALGAALVFIVICFRRLKRVATTLFAAALVFSIIYAAQGADLAAFSLVASRSAYLPAMVIVLTLLRLSTLRSTMVSEAGQFAVRQPPNRRYAFLTTGAHILGILFNIGGLILMLEIAISGRISANTPEHVAKIQMQRISTAVMRGFATTMIWSPLADIPQVACRLTSRSPDFARWASVFRPERCLSSRKRPKSGGSSLEPAAFWPGRAAFPRGRRTCPAAFVQLGHGSWSCA